VVLLELAVQVEQVEQAVHLEQPVFKGHPVLVPLE
jgi:hypothetical protein